MISLKKFHFKKKNSFVLFNLIFLNVIYYCSINLKRQSEHSGLCTDTSSLVAFQIELRPAVCLTETIGDAEYTLGR